MKDKKVKKIIVNSLSLSRIIGALLMPVVISAASIPGLVGILAFLFFTDFLDGKLARAWNVQTKGGSLLDPLGDKLLAFSCILSLLGTKNLLLTPLFLETGIVAININRALHEENVQSSLIGKIKTWLLSITIVLAVVNVLSPDILNNLLSHLPDSLEPVKNIDLTVTDEVVKVSSGVTVAAQSLTAMSYLGESFAERHKRAKKIAELKNAREILTRLFDETKYEEDKDKPVMKIIKKVR